MWWWLALATPHRATVRNRKRTSGGSVDGMPRAAVAGRLVGDGARVAVTRGPSQKGQTPR
jgi:hypothetical protein